MARKHFEWKVRDKLIQLGERTLLWECSTSRPIHFRTAASIRTPDRAFARAVEIEEEGADIIDIGAESTRPGSVAHLGSRGTAPSGAGAEAPAQQADGSDLRRYL